MKSNWCLSPYALPEKACEARKHLMLQAFCRKGNEGKPKRHRKTKKSEFKTNKTEEFAGFVHSDGDVSWWSGFEELKKSIKTHNVRKYPVSQAFCRRS